MGASSSTKATIVQILQSIISLKGEYTQQNFDSLVAALKGYTAGIFVVSKHIEELVESLVIETKPKILTHEPKVTNLMIVLFVYKIVHMQKYWDLLVELIPVKIDDSIFQILVNHASGNYSSSWISVRILSNIAKNQENLSDDIDEHKISSIRGQFEITTYTSSCYSYIKTFAIADLLQGSKKEEASFPRRSKNISDPIILPDVNRFNSMFALTKFEEIGNHKLLEVSTTAFVEFIDSFLMILWLSHKGGTHLVPYFVSLPTLTSLQNQKETHSVVLHFEIPSQKAPGKYSTPFAVSSFDGHFKSTSVSVSLQVEQDNFTGFLQILLMIFHNFKRKFSQSTSWLKLTPQSSKRKREEEFELSNPLGHNQTKIHIKPSPREIMQGLRSEQEPHELGFPDTSELARTLEPPRRLPNLTLVADSQPVLTPLEWERRSQCEQVPQITIGDTRIEATKMTPITETQSSEDSYDVFMEKITSTRFHDSTGNTSNSSIIQSHDGGPDNDGAELIISGYEMFHKYLKKKVKSLEQKCAYHESKLIRLEKNIQELKESKKEGQ